MEKNMSESKRSNFLRAGLLAAGVGFGTLVLAGCGQTTPPTGEQVRSEIKTFDLRDVTAANGEPVHCVMYGSDSQGTSSSKSWFGFACDFEGGAHFPSESQVTTTSTTVKPR